MSEVDRVVRIGADPEVFVRKAGGDIIPVCGLIGGTKEFPKPLPAPNKDSGIKGDLGIYAIQEDGVALEFNTPAFHNAEHFASGIDYAMKACGRMAKSRKLELVISSAHTWATPFTDERALKIGCLPDQDAYKDGEQREPYSADVFGNSRFCGGHIHLGYNKNNVPHYVMARFMDVLVGLPSLFEDVQGPRRQYYGKAGLYREKDYGIEYRTLSNYWVRSRYRGRHAYLIVLAQTVLDLGLMANTAPKQLEAVYDQVPWKDVERAIETENTGLATEISMYANTVLKLPVRYWRELTAGPGTKKYGKINELEYHLDSEVA